jgi:uncharacterized membrane protein
MLTLAAICLLPFVMLSATTVTIGDENATTLSWLGLILTPYAYLAVAWTIFGLVAWLTRSKIKPA